MKTNQSIRQHPSISLMATALVVLAVATSCSLEERSDNTQASAADSNVSRYSDIGTIYNAPGSGDAEGTQTDAEQLGLQPAAVRTYEELYSTYASLTGIDPTTESLRNYFVSNVASSLPSNNDAEMSATHQVATIKLATEFCSAALNHEDPAVARRLFGDRIRDESGAVSGNAILVLSSENREDMAKRLIKRFWGVPEIELTADHAGLNELKRLSTSLYETMTLPIAGGGTPAPTGIQLVRAIPAGMCAASLATAYVSFY